MEKYFLEWSNIKNHTLSVVIPAQAHYCPIKNKKFYIVYVSVLKQLSVVIPALRGDLGTQKRPNL